MVAYHFGCDFIIACENVKTRGTVCFKTSSALADTTSSFNRFFFS